MHWPASVFIQLQLKWRNGDQQHPRALGAHKGLCSYFWYVNQWLYLCCVICWCSECIELNWCLLEYNMQSVICVCLQAAGIKQPVVAITSSVSSVDCITAGVKCSSLSGRPCTVNCSTSVGVESTDSTSAATACRGDTETSSIISLKASRSRLLLIHCCCIPYLTIQDRPATA